MKYVLTLPANLTDVASADQTANYQPILDGSPSAA